MKRTCKKIYKNAGRILMITAFFIYTGCSEEFLKPDPLSFYEPAATFTTQAGLESTLGMADRHLRTYWSYWEYRDRGLPISTEYMFSEISVSGFTDNNLMFTDIANTLTPTNGIWDNDGNSIEYFWNETYNGIKYANTVVSFIDNVEGLEEDVRREYLGRAYFHRSVRYLALCFQFNDVPLITKILESPKFDYRSTEREAILEKIMLDMENAVEWVPEQSEMELIGEVNKGACRQLLIKIYLATGQWDKAIEQADILIDDSGYELMTEPFGTFETPFEQTWPITRNVIWDLHRAVNKSITTNTETILSMPNPHESEDARIKMNTMRNWLPLWDNRNELKAPSGENAVLYIPPSNSDYDPDYDYRTALGRGIAVIRSTPYFTKYLKSLDGTRDEGDLRYNSEVGNWVLMDSIKYNNPNDTEWYGENLRLYDEDDNILCSDTIRCWFDFPHYKTYVEDPEELTADNANHRGGAGDWYFYRLAETYLLRAEAKFYKGDIAGATEDVNIIRERAQCEEMYASVTIGDIMDERARELYLEEWRHMELSRVSYCLALSGQADEWGNTYSVDNLHEDSYWWQRMDHHNAFYNKGVVVPQLSNRPFTLASRNIYWPIPQYAIDANREGTLSQNPGYNGYDPSVPVWDNWEEAVADEDNTTSD